MQKVLILGYGYTGKSFKVAASSDEFEIIAARRNIDAIEGDVSKLKIDLFDVNTFSDIPKDINAIVYMASAGEFSKEAYHNTYYKGLKNILEYCKNFSKLKRFLFVSSTGVYADRRGGEVDEASIRDSSNPPQLELIRGEDLLLNGNFTFETSVVRFSGIYGKERRYLINKVKSGEVDLSDETYTNRIHEKDCGRVLVHLLKINNINKSYIATDDLPSTRKEVYTYLAEKLNIEVNEAINHTSNSNRYGSKRCLNKILKDSGFEFTYPSFKEGYDEILKDL